MADDAESNVDQSTVPSQLSAAPSGQQPTEEEEQQEHEEEEEEEEDTGPPEFPTLNTTSLTNLAAALGRDGLKLAMCLNVPTTILIQIQFQALEKGWVLDSIVNNMLFYWKLMKQTAKDRDKVNDLVRGLRHADLDELADAVEACYEQGVELTGLPARRPRPSEEQVASVSAMDDAATVEGSTAASTMQLDA